MPEPGARVRVIGDWKHIGGMTGTVVGWGPATLQRIRFDDGLYTYLANEDLEVLDA